MGPQAVTGWMAFLAFQDLPEMAPKAPQEMLVTQEFLESRASQERWAPQDWACQAPRESRASPEMQDSLGPRAFQVLQAPQAAQHRQTVTQV